GLRLGELHLAENGADDQHLGIAADLVADVLPAPALLALDIEQLFREVGSFHCSLPSRDQCAMTCAELESTAAAARRWPARRGPGAPPGHGAGRSRDAQWQRSCCD